MKKINSIILILLLVTLMFSGCAELVRSETTTVEAVVTDTYHRNAWMQPIRAGKVTTFVRHPAKNCVVVEYEEVTLTINDIDMYEQYKDKIGTTIQCELIVDYYDDGTCKRHLKFGD